MYHLIHKEPTKYNNNNNKIKHAEIKNQNRKNTEASFDQERPDLIDL